MKLMMPSVEVQNLFLVIFLLSITVLGLPNHRLCNENNPPGRSLTTQIKFVQQQATLLGKGHASTYTTITRW